jgi:hypothetical protein
MNSSSSDTSRHEMMRLRLAVSNAIDTWAILEYELARLLQTVINDENGMVGAAIYYSSTNIETSLRIVDAAIKAAMFNLGYGASCYGLLGSNTENDQWCKRHT